MNTNESIESALATLQSADFDAGEQPAVIRLAPDNDAYVLGNRDGYIKLAISALKAAQGETQSFEDESWVDTEELDWGLSGLKYDPAAQTYIRPRRNKRRGWFWDKFYLIIMAFIAIVIVGVLAAGLDAIFSGFKH